MDGALKRLALVVIERPLAGERGGFYQRAQERLDPAMAVREQAEGVLEPSLWPSSDGDGHPVHHCRALAL